MAVNITHSNKTHSCDASSRVMLTWNGAHNSHTPYDSIIAYGSYSHTTYYIYEIFILFICERSTHVATVYVCICTAMVLNKKVVSDIHKILSTHSMRSPLPNPNNRSQWRTHSCVKYVKCFGTAMTKNGARTKPTFQQPTCSGPYVVLGSALSSIYIAPSMRCDQFDLGEINREPIFSYVSYVRV